MSVTGWAELALSPLPYTHACIEQIRTLVCLALTVVLTKLPQSSKAGSGGVQPLERSQGRRYRERFRMGLDGEPDGTGVQKAQDDLRVTT